jgi:outer membrane protein OmpA-like peptidoglycan-associated protein
MTTTPGSSAGPAQTGGGCGKVLIIALVVLFLIGGLVVGGVLYAGYRVKKKADEVKSALGISGGESQPLPDWKNASSSIIGAPSSKVPVLAGLTVVTAINQPLQGDYESIKRIDAVSPGGVHLRYSAEVPTPDLGAMFGQSGKKEPPQKVRCGRTVLSADLNTAHEYQENFCGQGSEEKFPGSTAISLSREALAQLKLNGETKFSYQLAGLQGLVKAFKGMMKEGQSGGKGKQSVPPIGIPGLGGGDQGVICNLKRVGSSDLAFPVLVNNQRVELPALHASCKPADDDAEAHFYFLDDFDNPLALAWQIGGGTRLQVIKIEIPAAQNEVPSQQMEQQLATKGRVQVYGIYFDFGSDVLRPESEIVLQEIAQVLGQHPDWQLSIEGHTDNIGGDSYNLDLSNRRAAAVKVALVDRYNIVPDRLSTAGFGLSRPVDSNDTLEGRARNRRVELVKK